MEPQAQPQFTSYSGVTAGRVTSVGGSLTIRDSADTNFKVARTGGVTFDLRQDRGDIGIISVGGNITLEVPKGVALNLTNTNVTLNDQRENPSTGSSASAFGALRFSSDAIGGNATAHASASSQAVAGESSAVSHIISATQQSDQTFQNVAKIDLMNQAGGNVEILASPDSSVRVVYGSAIVDLGKKQCLDIVNRAGSQMTIYAPKDLEIETANQGGTLVDKRHQS